MDLFKIILKRSTDVINAQDNDGFTALHFAIIYNSKTALKELLSGNVNANVKNNDNFTALHYACCWKDIPADLFQIIQTRSTSDTINAPDKDGDTALHIAFLKNFQKTITLLLKDDRVNVHVKNNKNLTALYYSLEWPKTWWWWQYQKMSTGLAERIRIESLDVNAPDEVDVNAKNKKGRTALHLVCKENSGVTDNLIKIIIKQSTDVNEQDNKGDTALHLAIRNRNCCCKGTAQRRGLGRRHQK